jgi:hypothetical protein
VHVEVGRREEQDEAEDWNGQCREQKQHRFAPTLSRRPGRNVRP